MSLIPLLIGSLLCLLASGVIAQDCAKCAGRGSVPCKRRLHKPVEREVGVVFCSHSASCINCRGSLSKLCVTCGARSLGPEQRLLQKQDRARLERGLQKRLKLFADVPGRRGVVLCETARVKVAVSAPRGFKLSGKSADAHDLAHYCVEQITGLRARFMKLFELTEADFPTGQKRTSTVADPTDRRTGSPRIELYLLADAAAVRVLAPRVTDIRAQGLGVMKLGPRIAACLHFDQKTIREDSLHRHLAHVTAHLLLSNVLPSRPLGELGHGWIEVGVAHYFEDLETKGGCSVLCFGEQVLRPTGTYRGGDWRRAVFELMSAKKERSVRALVTMQQEELDLEGHAQSFAFVEFLLSQGQGGEQFICLIRALPDAKDPVAALEALYPSQQQDLDARFRVWVISRYRD